MFAFADHVRFFYQTVIRKTWFILFRVVASAYAKIKRNMKGFTPPHGILLDATANNGWDMVYNLQPLHVRKLNIVTANDTITENNTFSSLTG